MVMMDRAAWGSRQPELKAGRLAHQAQANGGRQSNSDGRKRRAVGLHTGTRDHPCRFVTGRHAPRLLCGL